MPNGCSPPALRPSDPRRSPSKAEQFADAYNLVRDYADDDGQLDVADAAVTLAVHAGITASDVICCARLGVHAQGDSHDEAKVMLGAAMAGMDKHLATLLAMKTRAGYSADPATRDMLVHAGRAMDHLVAAARAAHAT